MNAALSDLIQRLKASGRITADDVLAMRAEVYGADLIAPDELEALAALDALATDRSPVWGEFFAEAMVDFVVRQEDPPDYVSEAKAAWVMQVLSGKLKCDSGVDALAHILEAASGVPPELEAFALAKAKEALCDKGRISAADVATMRRLVFAGGGEGNLAVTREEADALFDITHACRASANDPAWTEFFAEAVGASLLSASEFSPESREEAAGDEAWLQGPTKLTEFMAGMTKVPDMQGALRELFEPEADAENEWRDENTRFEAQSLSAIEITDAEARWLIGRLSPGKLTEPERRLIEFLRERSPKVSDLIKPLLGASKPASADPPPVFGHRAKPPSAAKGRGTPAAPSASN